MRAVVVSGVGVVVGAIVFLAEPRLMKFVCFRFTVLVWNSGGTVVNVAVFSAVCWTVLGLPRTLPRILTNDGLCVTSPPSCALLSVVIMYESPCSLNFPSSFGGENVVWYAVLTSRVWKSAAQTNLNYHLGVIMGGMEKLTTILSMKSTYSRQPVRGYIKDKQGVLATSRSSREKALQRCALGEPISQTSLLWFDVVKSGIVITLLETVWAE